MSKELLIKCRKELEALNGLVVKSEDINCNFDDLINELSVEILKNEKTIDDYFDEWNNSLIELSAKEIELINLKELYSEREQEIIQTTDFKELYGANNADVRKNHVKKTLQSMTDAKNDLTISIDYLKRRIDFIKNYMAMQRTILECGAVE